MEWSHVSYTDVWKITYQMSGPILWLPHKVGGQKYILFWLLFQLTAWIPIKNYIPSDPVLDTFRQATVNKYIWSSLGWHFASSIYAKSNKNWNYFVALVFVGALLTIFKIFQKVEQKKLIHSDFHEVKC